MEKETNKQKVCPLLLMQLAHISPEIAMVKPDIRIIHAGNSVLCVKELCQWWWLCSGQWEFRVVNRLETIIVQLNSLIRSKHAKK